MSDRMELLCEKDRCLVDPQTIEMVNREQRRFGWTASNYTMFWGRRLSEGIQYRLGTLHSRRKVLSMTPLKQIIDRDALPASFDSRTRWRGLVGPPKDQGWCGSSWVYSTVGVASDRWMIMTKGRMHESLSHQHLLSCNNRNQRGCAGGHLSRAWAFIKKFGLVPESCYPWTGDTTRCNVPKQKSGQDARCVADPQGVERRPLFRMGPVYRVVTEEGIMQEIMSNGPVQATMKVNPDFFMYSGGIYKCSALPGSESGFHSVRIVGWGQEQQGGRPVKYWTVANSWGQDWGEGGFFRIRRGVNECKIEDFVLGAWANLETSRKPTVQEVFLRAAGVRLAALEVSSQSPFDEPYESTTYSNLSNEI
ncbi:hypothetical protein AAG570_007165 [Ranatra chinensis]|uniref:Peptidase C1A papain C-terminal domain-containing protein n=1 Tax=Ranatra chinensis TaxID=642074 RepID=A0ABD0XV55_9HEMI